MPSFGNLSSSASAVVATIFLLDHSEFPAAQIIHRVPVESWPDFERVKPNGFRSLEDVQTSFQSEGIASSSTEFDLKKHHINFVGEGTFGRVYSYSSGEVGTFISETNSH